MAFIYAMADTWNNNGTTFDAIRMSVTDTTSGAASSLINMVINGVTAFNVSKAGNIAWNGRSFTSGTLNGQQCVNTVIFGTVVAKAQQQTSGFAVYSLRMGSNLDDGNNTDVALMRAGAGLFEINDNTTASYAHLVLFTARTVGVTLASLPTAASVSAGGRAMITNGAAATFNTTAAGGGANVVPVFSDGTQWKYG